MELVRPPSPVSAVLALAGALTAAGGARLWSSIVEGADHRTAEPSWSTTSPMLAKSNMGSVQQRLGDLVSEISFALSFAPEYPSWSRREFKAHLAEIWHLWSLIRPQLSSDMGEVAIFEAALQEMLSAFEVDDQDGGRRAGRALIRMDLTKIF
ncbi:hypothetical protein J7E62_25735 [Variovorax paradoxus]|nr:hypothetical protein [Variovorax paradoxus]